MSTKSVSVVLAVFILATPWLAGPPAITAPGTRTIDLATSPPALTLLGARSVRATGDLNGDGAGDLVLETGSEEASILFGEGQRVFPSTMDLRTQPADVVITAPFRIWAALVSDLSGDGIGDLLLTDGSDSDRVFVLHGSAEWPAAVDLRVTPPDVSIGGLFDSPYVWFAAPSVATGDFNGDGRLDLAVGAAGKLCSSLPEGTQAGGAVFLFWSRDSQGRFPTNVPEAEAQADAAFCAPCSEVGPFGLACPQVGNAVAAPDLDGNGRADLAIGAHFSQLGPDPHTGLVHVYHARGNGRPFARFAEVGPFSGDVIIEGANLEFHTPERLLAADFSQDDRGDLFVATVDNLIPGGSGRPFGGEVRMLGGRPKPDPRVIRYGEELGDWNVFGAEAGDRAESIASGDVDGDGHADLLVGAAGAEGPGDTRPRRPGYIFGSGEAYLFRGRAFAPSDGAVVFDLGKDSPDLVLFGATGWQPPRRAGDGLGWSVGLTDFDGDGLDDLVLGEPGVPPPERPDADPIGAVVIVLSPFVP